MEGLTEEPQNPSMAPHFVRQYSRWLFTHHALTWGSPHCRVHETCGVAPAFLHNSFLRRMCTAGEIKERNHIAVLHPWTIAYLCVFILKLWHCFRLTSLHFQAELQLTWSLLKWAWVLLIYQIALVWWNHCEIMSWAIAVWTGVAPKWCAITIAIVKDSGLLPWLLAYLTCRCSGRILARRQLISEIPTWQ